MGLIWRGVGERFGKGILGKRNCSMVSRLEDMVIDNISGL